MCVILLEAMDKVLANMPEELSIATARALERKHVEIRFGAPWPIMMAASSG